MSKINDLKKQLSDVSDNAEIGDLVLNFFNKEFNTQDYMHLFRQERWKIGIYCPFCYSNNVKKLSTNSITHVFKYVCLDCDAVFADDTGSPLSGSNIPLQIWLQLWYLNQYCTSLQYIADKLNLDLNIVINMLHSMRQLFQQDQLLADKNNSLNEVNNLSNKTTLHLEEKFKKFLILGGDTGKQPFDTAEYRRQKNIKNNNNQPNKKPRV